MATQGDISSQIRSALAVSEPDLDTSTGTVIAKIVDAVANSIANVYLDQHLLTYSYDIDSKIDADLDNFVQLFGMSRMAAIRSTGIATFSRSGGDLTSIAFLSVGTQISDGASPPNVFQCITGGVIPANVTSINVPVQAVNPGAQGNVDAQRLVQILTPVTAISAVTNVSATSGGQAQESDTALRARWKSTVFRNLAGTEQMYLGTALADPDCFAANVVTATKLVREQLQFSTTTVASNVTDAKYVFPTPVTLGVDIDDSNIFNKGSDYTFAATIPPTVTAVNSTNIPTGTVADLEYEYTPVASRNDPATGIINRVDVYCGGNRDISAIQSVVLNTALVFSSSGTYPAANFQRTSGSSATIANVFVPLAFGPISTMSSTIVVGGTTYGLVTPAHPVGVSGGITYAYRIIHDVTNLGMTPASLFGLEWDAAHLPPNGSVLSIGGDGVYTYNQIPSSIQSAIDNWRLAGIDARAHQALYRPIKFNFAVVYDRGATPSLVNQAMDAVLTQYVSSLGMNAGIQVSDVLQLLHNVAGVDNIRFLNTGDDSPTNGIAMQQLALDNTLLTTYTDVNGRAKDIYLTDAELPVFGSSRYLQKARNSFGLI